MDSGVNNEGEGQMSTKGVPLLFFKESELFGSRKPTKSEWLLHEELFNAIGKNIDSSHITRLQRVRGMWRIYLDNIEDKVTLMNEGVPLRGKSLHVLNTNPDRLDGENTIKIRIKNVPLSVYLQDLSRSEASML